MQQRVLISGGLHKQIIPVKLKPRAHRKKVIISRICGATITTRVLNCIYFLLARLSDGFRSNNSTIKTPPLLRSSYRRPLKSMDDNKLLKRFTTADENMGSCGIITLMPVIQSLRLPARCNIKTPLHWQRLMQKQRLTFQTFFFAPASVYCSSRYHHHIPFQTDSYHKLCGGVPPFRSQLNVMALGLFLA